MAKLTYLTNMSVDGCIEDRTGEFALFPHDPEVFAATTEILRGFRTLLYGRRLYELMAVWETDPSLAATSDLYAAFTEAWKAPDKIVWSRTLTEVSTAKTRIERDFDLDAVRTLKDAADGDLLIGGANIASQAIDAGLVDECELLVWPATIGGGKPALSNSARVDFELLDEHRFANGVVHLRYALR